jgi:hypothetical protein
MPPKFSAPPTLVAGPEATKLNSQLPLSIKVAEKPQMLEINPGIWDGLSPEQAKKYYPEDWERFLKDPYSFRAPRAESYHDLSGMQSSLSPFWHLSHVWYLHPQCDWNLSSSNSRKSKKICSSSVTLLS